MSNTPSDDGFHISTELNFQRPELSEFLEYWEQKKGGREFPQRSDIKPAEIVRLLPWINMYDVLDGGEEFSVRVVGTALTEVIGEEMRGKTVSGLRARSSRNCSTSAFTSGPKAASPGKSPFPRWP